MSKTISAAYPIAAVDGITVNTSLPSYKGNYVDYSKRLVTYIVFHYTGNAKDTAKANANYFHNGFRDAGAHYFVDEESIYQSVELRDAAGHCGANVYKHPSCRNSNSVGVEMCCSGSYKVSGTTKAHAVELGVALCEYLGIGADQVDTCVLRHYDVTGKLCPAQMAGADNAEWEAFKAAIKTRLLAKSAPKDTTNTNVEGRTCEVTLPVLKKGMQSGYVKTAQILLNKYNKAGLAEDGGFGDKTYAAVVAYQKSRKLDVDGVIGTQTWGQLLK